MLHAYVLCDGYVLETSSIFILIERFALNTRITEIIYAIVNVMGTVPSIFPKYYRKCVKISAEELLIPFYGS